MNGAPDWRDGENCFRCRAQFSLVARKHHCRNCGNIFCAKCSSQQIPLPKLNIEKNVRVCDGCYEKLASDKGETSSLISKSSEDTTKPSADTKKSTAAAKKQASAPSELDLKEEEELQLALALSMSEETVKIDFPDCKTLEDSAAASSSSNGYNTSRVAQHSAIQPQTTSQVAPPITLQPSQSQQQQQSVPQTTSFPNINSNLAGPATAIQPQPDHDSDLFNFVAECQSAAEVFTNRVTSNKLRNRPIATDPAIQKQFLDLTNMQTRLLELIKQHDVQRVGLEAVQDKISQITDARAALDALREEHQEKLREEAAEAERQRHSKLALKLEMMRQKKSEMMQHQRDLALQRIQAQEMLLGQQHQQQHLQQPYPQAPPTTVDPVPSVAPVTQVATTQPNISHIPYQQQSFQHHTTQHYELPPPPAPPTSHMSQIHHQMLEQQAMPVPPPPPPPKQEEEALLISFDD